MDDEKYQIVRDYSLKLLSFRPRSTHEVRGKLIQFAIKRGISKKIVETVITDLTQKKFLNDLEFAAWWKEQRQKSKPKGARAIRQELLQKGITKDIIESVLVETQEERDKEFHLARALAEKKRVLYENIPKDAYKRKISQLLLRRGFAWETIYRVIDSLLKTSYNTDNDYGDG